MNSLTTIRVLFSLFAILLPNLITPKLSDSEHPDSEPVTQLSCSTKSAIHSMMVAVSTEQFIETPSSPSRSEQGTKWPHVWQCSIIHVALLFTLLFSLVGLFFQNQRIRKRQGELVELLEKTRGMLQTPGSIHSRPGLDAIEILNRVTHEIRNPLSVILSTCQALRSQPESQVNWPPFVDTIENRVRQINVSVEGFLEFACVERGMVQPWNEPICLLDEFKHVSELVAYQIAQPAFETKIHTMECVPKWIKVDGGKLRQILLFMIREASLRDFNSVEVAIRDRSPDDGPLTLGIVVTSPTPAQQHLDASAPAKKSRPQQNTFQTRCPDFSTVQKLTECMGGKISCAHSAQRTCVELSIPYETSSNLMNDPHEKPSPDLFGSLGTTPEEQALDSSRDQDSKGSLAKTTVLIVDDETALLVAVQSLLGQQGYDVLTSSSSQEALECIQQNSVDLVITDLTMPGGDGYELLRQVRRLPKHSQLPVVATTGNVTPDLRAQVKNAGFNHLLTKPYWIEDLLMAIRVATGKQ